MVETTHIIITPHGGEWTHLLCVPGAQIPLQTCGITQSQVSYSHTTPQCHIHAILYNGLARPLKLVFSWGCVPPSN